MLELPEVSILTKFGSGVSPDLALVSTGQLLATLPGGSGNWLPKSAGLPTGPRVPFPSYPALCVSPSHPRIMRPLFFIPIYALCIPFFIPIPALCVSPVKDPTLHCTFPYIPHPTSWRHLMSLLPFPFPALCDYPSSPFPLATSPFPHCAYPLP